MSEKRLILVTHKKPDFDAVASIYLWLKAHKIPWDSRSYVMKFVNPGQRYMCEDESVNETSETKIIHFDTGRMHDDLNFDHHQLNTREISATGLVWKCFCTPGENPAIDELVAIVNHSDNGMRYYTQDLVARNLFTLGFHLSGANKLDKNGVDFTNTMIYGFCSLDHYLINHQEVETLKNITKNMEIFITPLGRTVFLQNVPVDSSAIRSYLKKYHNGERGPLVNTVIAHFLGGSIGIIVCIDPGQEQHDFEDGDDDNYPQTISLINEMTELYEKLKTIEPNIYLHQSGFALFINRTKKISLIDVLKLIRIEE